MAGTVALITGTALLYEVYAGQARGPALAAVALFYGATSGVIVAFATWTAQDIGLPSFLLLMPISRRQRWARLLLYGVGVGVALAIGSVVLSGLFAASGSNTPALQPWFWRRIQTPAGVTLFAARAAVLEEAFFRLFLIPLLAALVLRARRPRYRFTVREGRARIRQDNPEVGGWALAAAVVGSSVVFGLAHPFGPAAAVALAPLLALAFLRGGWESATLAHFLANWLVFTFYF